VTVPWIVRQILAEKFPHLRRGSGGALVLVVGYNFVTCTPQLQPAPLAGGGGYILYRWLATAVLSRLIEGHNSSSIIEELRKIDREAWVVVGTSFDEIVPSDKDAVVPVNGTTVPK